jgi:hypothetical protein
VKSEETSIARQRLGEYIPAATNVHAIEEPASNEGIGNNRGILGNGVFSLVRAKWLLRRGQLRRVSRVPKFKVSRQSRDGSGSREPN